MLCADLPRAYDPFAMLRHDTSSVCHAYVVADMLRHTRYDALRLPPRRCRPMRCRRPDVFATGTRVSSVRKGARVIECAARPLLGDAEGHGSSACAASSMQRKRRRQYARRAFSLQMDSAIDVSTIIRYAIRAMPIFADDLLFAAICHAPRALDAPRRFFRLPLSRRYSSSHVISIVRPQ